MLKCIIFHNRRSIYAATSKPTQYFYRPTCELSYSGMWKVDQCPKPLYRRTGGVEADRIGGNRWRWRRAVKHPNKKKVIVKVGCNRTGRAGHPMDGYTNKSSCTKQDMGIRKQNSIIGRVWFPRKKSRTRLLDSA